MGWFAVDDGFDNHPKIRKAGNAAAGLFCRLGSYCSRNATEGVIPGPVARDYGTAAQFRKLAEVGMLHGFGHVCRDCVQPEAGGFVMHDYLQYNRSRKEIEDARKAGVERQRRRRARLAEEARAAETGGPTGASPEGSPGASGEPPGGVAPEPPVSDKNATSDGPVTADAAEERARQAQPSPTSVPPAEEQLASATAPPPRPAGVSVPANCTSLVASLTAAGVIVSWSLGPDEWAQIEARIGVYGIRGLVDFIVQRRKANDPPQTGRYLLRMWSDLPLVDPDAAIEPGGNVVRLQTGGHQPYRQPAPEARANDKGF